MGDLSEVFGEDFEQEYQSESQKRREKQNKVDKETLKKICYKAVKGGGFKGSEPRFVYEGDAIPHDVMLMQAPESKFSKFKHPFKNGGMSVGMFHLEEVFSCAFNEDMMSIVEKIEEGEHYIVVGNYEEKKDIDGSGNENVYYNVNPVRGIVPVKVAKKYAEEYDEKRQGTSVDEQLEDQGQEVEGSNDDEEDIDLDSGSDEPSDSDILKVLKLVADKKEHVIKSVADGDADSLSKLVGVVDNNVEGEVTEDHVRTVFESEITEIEDEEEEDDDLDMGGLGLDDDEDSSDNKQEEEPEPEPEDTSEAESDDEDNEDSVDDWF